MCLLPSKQFNSAWKSQPCLDPGLAIVWEQGRRRATVEGSG